MAIVTYMTLQLLPLVVLIMVLIMHTSSVITTAATMFRFKTVTRSSASAAALKCAWRIMRAMRSTSKTSLQLRFDVFVCLRQFISRAHSVRLYDGVCSDNTIDSVSHGSCGFCRAGYDISTVSDSAYDLYATDTSTSG